MSHVWETPTYSGTLGVGRKGESGAPVDKDRFYIGSPVLSSREFQGRSGKYAGMVHELHPQFSLWNAKADKHLRQSLSVVIMHQKLEEAFAYTPFRAYQLKAFPAESGNSCEGDGDRAMRWVKGERKEIACPGTKCEFYQRGECKVHISLIVVPMWDAAVKKLAVDRGFPEPPELPLRYQSSGRHMASSLLSFISSAEKLTGKGRRKINWQGCPILMSLGEKSSKANRTRYPVVTFSQGPHYFDWLKRESTHQPEQLPEATIDLALPMETEDA